MNCGSILNSMRIVKAAKQHIIHFTVDSV